MELTAIERAALLKLIARFGVGFFHAEDEAHKVHASLQRTEERLTQLYDLAAAGGPELEQRFREIMEAK